MPSLVEKKPISITVDGNGNPTTLVEFEDTVSVRHVVPIIHGGTGADTASDARTNLGLGALATLSTVSVSQLASNIDATDIGFIAYKAEQLETARLINGVSFDGTQNITFDTDDVNEGSTNLYYTDARVSSYLTTNSYATQSYVDSAVASENEISEMNDVTLTSLTTSQFLQYNGSVWVNITIDSDDVAEGSTNVYYTSSRFDTDFSGKDTDDLTEGLTNQYFTTARVDTEIDSYVTGGTGVTVSSGTISIGQAVSTTSDVQFNDVQVDGTLSSNDITASTVTVSGNAIITGDLTVQGTTTQIDSNTVNIGDNTIVLNSDETGTPSLDAGIEIQRGTDSNKSLLWNETTDKWTVGSETFSAGTLEGTLNSSTINFNSNTGIIQFAVTVANNGSQNVYYLDGEETASIQFIPGLTYRFDVSDSSVATHPFRFSTTQDGTHNSGTNYSTGVTVSGTTGTSGAYVEIAVDASTPDLLYYYCTSHSGMGGTGVIQISGTDLSSNDTDDLSEGSTNLYYTSGRFDTDFSGKSTTDLTEGTNLYYTTTRVNSDFDTRLATKDTDDLAEGATNIYFTEERVDDRVANLIQAGTDISVTYNDSAGTLTIANTATVNTEDVQDIVGAQIVTNGSHTGISFSYDDANDGAIDATVSLSSFNTDNLSEGSTNLYFTNTRVDTEIDSYLTGGTGVTISSGTISIGQDVSTTSDVTFSSVTSDIDGAIIITGKNESGSTIAAGVPVYISGQAASGTEFAVAPADADGSGTMPAIGITTASANNNASVSILTFGKFVGLNTSSFSVGDSLYVSTSGTLVNTPPTGESSLLQKIAKVTRSHATDGAIFVQGAGRSNAVPNLDDGDIFIGNASNQAVTASFNTLADTRADIRIAAANLEDLNNIGFSAPTSTEDGKVVFWDDTSGSFLLSSVGGLAGSGEANTASNVGTAGVGIFKQKTVEDLEFKKINAGSSKITITDDTANDEVDIDLGTVNLGDLSNVSSTSPQANQVLKWDSVAGQWQPENESVSAEDVGVSLGLVLALS